MQQQIAITAIAAAIAGIIICEIIRLFPFITANTENLLLADFCRTTTLASNCVSIGCYSEDLMDTDAHLFSVYIIMFETRTLLKIFVEQGEDAAVLYYNKKKEKIKVEDYYDDKLLRFIIVNRAVKLLDSILDYNKNFAKKMLYLDDSERIINDAIDAITTKNEEKMRLISKLLILFVQNIPRYLINTLFTRDISNKIQNSDDLVSLIQMVYNAVNEYYNRIGSDANSYADFVLDSWIQEYDNYFRDIILLMLAAKVNENLEDGLIKSIQFILTNINKTIDYYYYNNHTYPRISAIIEYLPIWGPYYSKLYPENALRIFNAQYARRVFERFIALGGDINLVAPDGTTPLVFARKIGNENAVNILKYFGAKNNNSGSFRSPPFVPRRNNSRRRSLLSSFMVPGAEAAAAGGAEAAAAGAGGMGVNLNNYSRFRAERAAAGAAAGAGGFPNSRRPTPRTKKLFGVNAPNWTRRNKNKN